MSESDAAVVREARDLLLEFAAHADDVNGQPYGDRFDLLEAVEDKALPMADRLGPVLARMEAGQ